MILILDNDKVPQVPSLPTSLEKQGKDIFQILAMIDLCHVGLINHDPSVSSHMRIMV
jgi:hypothetical protein